MRIDESTYKDIVPPETVGDSFARGINSLADISAVMCHGHGFILDGDMYIAPLDCPGWPDFGISGIDDNGRFAGTCGSDTAVAAIYDGTTWTLFQCGDAEPTVATAINNDGVVVGWYGAFPFHGFVTFDMGKTCVTIDYPDAPNTLLSGISSSGNLVGSYFDNGAIHFVGFLATPKETLRTAK